MSAPTFIQEAETAWTSANPKTTASFNVNSGDILVAIGMTEDAGATLAITDSLSLTWTQQQVINVANYSWVSIWTATVSSTTSMTVTFTRSGSAYDFGGNVFTFRNSDGIGASAKTNVSSGAPTLNITTQQANSAIVVANADWNVISGGSRVWRTNAGALTEQTYYLDSGHCTVYGGYHADSGAVNTYAVGLSLPAGQKYSIIACEIKGSSGFTAKIRRTLSQRVGSRSN